ncbi:hypothetical protein BDB00DRAFT_842592 [Zychaea mexicana]|uniref:uncharacterized protein n=1 Tax=Zychaea mexicana TaxID=64656 RepID=UPI0022FEAE51|nr:uncharacterized protein BDB00DRAFT_842592 [Zychaea mexicana]KAI9489583.1 hypothetical protein BDB00DRAFT_842592 [Zychaea mexicana]
MVACHSWVFLGVAYTGLENDEEAEKSYRRAIEINSDQLLAWHGLVSFYEKRGRKEDMAQIIHDILPKVIESNDANRLVEYLNKLVDVYESTDQDKYIVTLKLFLPGSPYYDLIKDTKSMRRPIDIWTTITNLTEADQSRMVESRVQSRRMGIHAGPPEEMRAQVEAEVYSKSQLGDMYENLLKLSDSPDTIQALQLKLLSFWFKRLPAIVEKSKVYKDITDLANKLVQTDVNDALPYEILIETTDAQKIGQYDKDLLSTVESKFPETGLAKLIQGYNLYQAGEIDSAFDMFAVGMELIPGSLFGYQCLSWIYYECKEYETGLEYATKGRDIVRKKGRESGKALEKVLISMELCMAHCYRHLNTKYYPDATALYKKVLALDPNEISALEGVGLILREENHFDQALKNFEKVYSLDRTRHISLAEIGWIYCEKEDYDKAIQYICQAIDLAEEDVADYYYRLGRVYWAIGGENTSQGFKYFMQAVKLDPEFASGFTYIGHYYREVKNDHMRAKKCYQKAFMLDTLDTDAAFHLSNYYIKDTEANEAEAVFKQITELVPKTGWAWRRLGYSMIISNQYAEAITCFQKALRCDTSDLRCWEGLAEAYAHEGRFVAAIKAFGRATDLDPSSVHANYEKALVKQKIGLLDEAVEGFNTTLELAEQQNQPNYLPAIKGLADTYIEQAKEEIQKGFFGRAADSCGKVIKTSLVGLEQDPSIVGFWKLIGDACTIYRIVPTNLHLCAYTELQQAMVLLMDGGKSPHQRLGFPENDMSAELLNDFVGLDVTVDDFYLPPKTVLGVVLACAMFAYKQALVLCKGHRMIAPALWHDLALLYHWMAEENRTEEGRDNGLVETAMRCIRTALKQEPSQYLYWNTLGVVAIRDSPKISHYAFIKAMELNSRSAVPWTNYGFLCLSRQDYELANQAFDMAHALDPEWISAWVGQAYVASLWGTSDAGGIFQHAFESSYGAATESSYGYAETAYTQLSSLPSVDENGVNIIISPAFALQKLTEQKLDDALALNLLGLLLERMGQYDRASEALAGAILALEAQCEQGRITQEEMNQRVAKVHCNLGRTLCANENFEGAISSYQSALEHCAGSSRVYCQLGAGIAYYFTDQLEDSLNMFETALNETQTDVDLRMDVTVLLSKVLWALDGDEQRAVAKDQMFSSIADNPNYLPAIFSLCVMGILEDDDTLTDAALQELAKIPVDVAFDTDKDQKISWLFSRYFRLKNDPEQAIRSLAKSVHRLPWLAGLWSHLASDVLEYRDTSVTSCASARTKNAVSLSALTMTSNSKTATADSKAEAYEHASQASLADQDETSAKQHANRAVMIAPWRVNAWKTMAAVHKSPEKAPV